jgi:hypothetical protein
MVSNWFSQGCLARNHVRDAVALAAAMHGGSGGDPPKIVDRTNMRRAGAASAIGTRMTTKSFIQ